MPQSSSAIEAVGQQAVESAVDVRAETKAAACESFYPDALDEPDVDYWRSQIVSALPAIVEGKPLLSDGEIDELAAAMAKASDRELINYATGWTSRWLGYGCKTGE